MSKAAKQKAFFELLSGKIEYSVQWKAWDKLCQEYDTDGLTILGLLNRAANSVRASE